MESTENHRVPEPLIPKTEIEDFAPCPPVQLSDGSHVQLYKDGQALEAAYRAIELARRRVCLEIYIFHADSTGRAFADLLARKAREGVEVFILYDSFGCWDTSNSIFELLNSAGCHLTEFHPLNPVRSRFGWRPINRDHRKLLLVDDEIAGFGGLNIGVEYGSSSIIKTEASARWRDNGFAIVGPASRVLADSFNKTWKYCHTGGPIRRAELLHRIDGEVGVLASVPTVNSPLLPLLHRLIHSARRSIDLTMAYFAPDDRLIAALCESADRGVLVRLMLPGLCDVPLLQIAARSFYELLLTHGVQIYERQGSVLHAKTLVIDAFVNIVGSTNLDYRSIEYNLELSAIIRNEKLGKQMTELFEHDIRFAKRIRLEQWRYRPTRDKLIQWMVSRARYLL